MIAVALVFAALCAGSALLVWIAMADVGRHETDHDGDE